MAKLCLRMLGVCGAASLACVVAQGQMTTRVSVDSAGEQADLESGYPAVSGDGRFVAFESYASNLVPLDDIGYPDVFVHDRITGKTELVSVDSAGVRAQGNSMRPSISTDGRYVAFHSYAANLVVGDNNGAWDVFVRDRVLGTTARVSVGAGGAEADGTSADASISSDGRYVAFRGSVTNLVAGDTNLAEDVFVHDRVTGVTVRASVDSSGVEGNDESLRPSISGDGRYVAYSSYATNLVPGDTNDLSDVFVRDLLTGTTVRASVDSAGAQGDGDSYLPALSGDGRWLSFSSQAGNLVLGDTNAYYDVFVRDLLAGTTERVSVGSGGVQGNAASYGWAISQDGRYVSFYGAATNLVSGNTFTAYDVYLRDRQTGTTERASVSPGGIDANDGSDSPSVSSDGRYVAFRSRASNLVAGDTNSMYDVFVHDREASGFTSVCEAGLGDVIACPCGNPPSGRDRGCDNSSGTGGARLEASGIAYLSFDTLRFTASDERPTALSILTQWSGRSSTGAVFGMGVRCTSGTLKRLYSRVAVAGTVSMPDFGQGDATVSARSSALGDTILAGQSRWYLVYYRDPVVLGGCPATSTFNATQTGRVSWAL